MRHRAAELLEAGQAALLLTGGGEVPPEGRHHLLPQLDIVGVHHEVLHEDGELRVLLQEGEAGLGEVAGPLGAGGGGGDSLARGAV